MFCTYEQAGLQYGCSYRATALQMQSTEHHDVLTAAPTRQLTVPNATFTESYFSTWPHVRLYFPRNHFPKHCRLQCLWVSPLTCPNRPTLLHYMPQPPHITTLHAPTAPHYSIQSLIFVKIHQPLPPPHPFPPTTDLSSLRSAILSLSLSPLPFFSHYAVWFRRKDQYFVRWNYRLLWRTKAHERVSVIRNFCRGRVVRMFHLWTKLSLTFPRGSLRIWLFSQNKRKQREATSSRDTLGRVQRRKNSSLQKTSLWSSYW